jgi:hypothetical protein
MGLVKVVQPECGPFLAFTITMAGIHEAEKAENEGTDIVESVKLTLRKHPVAGWFFVAFSAVVALATAVNQIVGALKAIGWWHAN